MTSLAAQFYERFAGLLKSHGTYAVGTGLTIDDKGKFTGKRKTVHKPYTAALWETHLAGTYAIGVVPINEQSLCYFGAIDIDEYNLDLKALNALVQALNLPLIVCRTKSGGAHLYLFLSEPAPAKLVRAKLTRWAEVLGHAGVEIFPKQDTLDEEGTGNWINMPYAGGEFSNRYALDPETGDALTPEDFLKLAEKTAIAPAELSAIIVNPLPVKHTNGAVTENSDDLLFGAPPCIIRGFAEKKFGDWDNNMMFNLARYAKARWGVEKFWDHLPKLNALLENPLSASEVQGVGKSIAKRDYFYLCEQSPIKELCDKKACAKCAFGITKAKKEKVPLSDTTNITFGDIVKLKTDPVTWIIMVNDRRLEIDTPSFMNQLKFAAAVIEATSFWPRPMKPTKWMELVQELMDNAEEVDVPEDATREGQWWSFLHRFCTGKVTAKELDEVLMGKPYTDESGGLVYFQSSDFLQYLQQHRVSGIDERAIWKFLHRRRAISEVRTIKGKIVNLWVLPAFSKQTEEFKQPTVNKPEAM
jgi:hypothetical protein